MTPTRRAVAFAGALGAYAALLALSVVLLSGDRMDGQWRTVVALLPVPAAAVIVLIATSAFLASDELEQRTRLIGLALSFVGTLLLTLSWGFLEGVGFEPLSGFVVFGVLVALYVIGLAFAQRRYR
jgi:hypothetical protein